MYTAFASVYDRLMAQVDYESWADHYIKLMRLCGVPEHGKCCECACGTGSITIRLAKAGYRMTGVDLSGEMLERAMIRARENGQTIPFVCRNMTDLALPGRVHAVLATCDGVNYLTRDGEMAAFFRAANAALRPGGALIFDISTPEKLRNVLGNGTLCCDEEDCAYIWRNHFNEIKKLVSMELSIFARRADGTYDRIEEKQTQRAFDKAEITAALKAAGFGAIRYFGRMRMTAPRMNDDRWHVCAIKEEEK